MIKWVVGEHPDGGTLVGKFPPENQVHALDKIPQPAVITKQVEAREIELEVGADFQRFSNPFQKKSQQPIPDRRVHEEERWHIADRNGKARFTGQPGGVDANAWFVVREVTTSTGKEYQLTRADRWLTFAPLTTATESAPDLETSEQTMKDSKIKAKTEFNEYLKLKRKKAQELGIAATPADGSDDDTDPKNKLRQKKKLLRRMKGGDGDDVEVAESSVAFLGIQRDIEGEWEGEEAFSDDDEQLGGDEANEHAELGIDVEDDDVEKDKVAPEDDDLEAQAEELFKDTFGQEIQKLMVDEQQKEHVGEDDLDDELGKYAGLADEDEEAPTPEDEGAAVVKTGAKPEAAPTTARKTSKEEQIRARVKGMFWRNEYKLKLKDILAQFPGLNRASEEYQFLTKALKDLAEVKDGVLHLRQQFRK
jgi:hypothetical protein